MKRAVLWDFDGTLAHTAPDMVAALHNWQQAHGQAPVEYERARMAVSGGARALLALAGVDAGAADFEAAREEFLEKYEEVGYKRSVCFGGIRETLTALAAEGWAWGVVTNKPRRYFSPIAAELQIHTDPESPPGALPLAAALVAGDDCAQPKPAPESLLLAAEIIGVAPANCMYVGDDVRDAQAAQAATMPFILAGWGYWPAAEWRQAAQVAALAATPVAVAPLARMLAGGGV